MLKAKNALETPHFGRPARALLHAPERDGEGADPMRIEIAALMFALLVLLLASEKLLAARALIGG